MKLGKYKHFKGGLYEVIEVARDSENLKEMIVYKNLYDHPKFGKNQLWIRNKKMFLEKIERDGKKMPRFKYVGK